MYSPHRGTLKGYFVGFVSVRFGMINDYSVLRVSACLNNLSHSACRPRGPQAPHWLAPWQLALKPYEASYRRLRLVSHATIRSQSSINAKKSWLSVLSLCTVRAPFSRKMFFLRRMYIFAWSQFILRLYLIGAALCTPCVIWVIDEFDGTELVMDSESRIC